MTAHAGIIPSDQAEKLYAYPALNDNQAYGLQGDGTWINHYCSVSTAAGTAAKTATCAGFKKAAGNWLVVFNANSNTADSLTLNVNNTGAVILRDQYTVSTASIDPKRFVKGMYLLLVSNAGNYLIVSAPIQHYETYRIDGMYYSRSANTHRFFDCTTAAATVAKVATNTSTSFSYSNGSSYHVRFSATNTATNPTLKLNDSAAVPMYTYDGTRLTGTALKAGMYHFIWYGNGLYQV